MNPQSIIFTKKPVYRYYEINVTIVIKSNPFKTFFQLS